MTKTKIEAGPDAPKHAQAALINAKEGDVIEFGEGRFDFKSTLSLDVERRDDPRPGARQDHLELQGPGARHRRRRTADHQQDDVTLEDLAVEDAKGDGIKVNGTKGSSSATSAPSGPAAPRRPTAATASTPCSARTC